MEHLMGKITSETLKGRHLLMGMKARNPIYFYAERVWYADVRDEEGRIKATIYSK